MSGMCVYNNPCFVLPEYGPNLVVQAFTTVAHIENLQCLLDCDATLESLVVHEELHEVEQFARLQTSLVRDATLIHCVVLVTTHITVEIIIYLLKSTTILVGLCS